MEYAIIIGSLVLIVSISTIYTNLRLSFKKQLMVDLCIFSLLCIATIATGFPNNLLSLSFLFLAWTLLGNGFKMLYAKLWERIDNWYLRKVYIPPNKEEKKHEESANTYICRLMYVTIELGLIAIFIRALILSI